MRENVPQYRYDSEFLTAFGILFPGKSDINKLTSRRSTRPRNGEARADAKEYSDPSVSEIEKEITMKKTLCLMALSAALSIEAFADDWSGKLIDATCNDQKQARTVSCDATGSTTTFAIEVAGRMYKLDAAGNFKAATALRNRADRSTDPAKASAGVMATVIGTEHDGTITVENITVK